MSRRFLLKIIFALLQIQCTLCLIDPITIGFGALGIGALTGGYYKYVKCRIQECCDQDYIPVDVLKLESQLTSRLHGQQIATKTVLRALNGYKLTDEPPKALTLSFHGPQGSGKNFVAQIIAETFYKLGMKSEYFHFFNGRAYASVESRLQEYKDKLREIIVKSLKDCERSMFVFDEVDMMPVGLLDVLVPFLDYVKFTTAEYKSQHVKVTSNKAVYIFLSNTGSIQIMQQMVKFWTEGNNRKAMVLKDFENLIAIGAFNENGGFLKSDAIRTSLIDYYVPFLPLEEEHVKLCMRDAFKRKLPRKPTASMEEEVLSSVTYGPEPHNIYAKSGCKKIEQKVISVVYDEFEY